MRNYTLKRVLTFIVLAVMVVIALKVLKWALVVVLPIALVAFAGYVVYTLIKGRS